MASSARVSWLSAIGSIGWYPIVFAVVVSGPSVLSLLQSLFVDHELVPALQWIVDGYDGIMDVVAALAGPLLGLVVVAVNSLFGLELALGDHWRPLFALMTAFSFAFVRAHRRDNQTALAVGTAISSLVGALVGAAIAGMMPLRGGWWVDGLTAAIPASVLLFSVAVSSAILRQDLHRWERLRWLAGRSLYLAPISGGVFVLATLVSLITPFGGGILLMAIASVAIGALAVWHGVHHQNIEDCRTGYTILGGFVVAAGILVAHVLLLLAGWSPPP